MCRSPFLAPFGACRTVLHRDRQEAASVHLGDHRRPKWPHAVWPDRCDSDALGSYDSVTLACHTLGSASWSPSDGYGSPGRLCRVTCWVCVSLCRRGVLCVSEPRQSLRHRLKLCAGSTADEAVHSATGQLRQLLRVLVRMGVCVVDQFALDSREMCGIISLACRCMLGGVARTYMARRSCNPPPPLDP